MDNTSINSNKNTNINTNIVLINELDIDNIIEPVNILCYHINNSAKYPFIQFLLEQSFYGYSFPTLIDNYNIEGDSITYVMDALEALGCKSDAIYYAGMTRIGNQLFSVLDISTIDIYSVHKSRHIFALFNEIVNTQSVYDINISKECVDLCTDNPMIGVLMDENGAPYMCPDGVYTGNEKKSVEFKAIFNNCKTKAYSSCGYYYYFYKSYMDAKHDGTYLPEGNSDRIGNRMLVKNGTNKYISGGVNRYALFVDGRIYLETNDEFMLTDDMIQTQYPNPCVLICYLHERNQMKPDILVKELEQFVSLSYTLL